MCVSGHPVGKVGSKGILHFGMVLTGGFDRDRDRDRDLGFDRDFGCGCDLDLDRDRDRDRDRGRGRGRDDFAAVELRVTGISY